MVSVLKNVRETAEKLNMLIVLITFQTMEPPSESLVVGACHY